MLYTWELSDRDSLSNIEFFFFFGSLLLLFVFSNYLLTDFYLAFMFHLMFRLVIFHRFQNSNRADSHKSRYHVFFCFFLRKYGRKVSRFLTHSTKHEGFSNVRRATYAIESLIDVRAARAINAFDQKTAFDPKMPLSRIHKQELKEMEGTHLMM